MITNAGLPSYVIVQGVGYVQAIKGIRENVQIATKFGLVNSYNPGERRAVRGDPEYVRSACEASLKRLGVDCIDLYYQHRLDDNTPIEVTVSIPTLQAENLNRISNWVMVEHVQH